MSATLDLALPLIKQFEGCRLSAYRCPAGIPTIGWGRTQGVRMGDTCTQQQADDWLEAEAQDIITVLTGTIPYWGEMKPTQQAALVSFAYNLGSHFYGALDFASISKRLAAKDWAGVPDALLLYRNPGTAFEEGLKRRRIAEGQLWASTAPIAAKPQRLVITATRDTYLKKSTAQSSSLPDTQKKAVRAGDSYRVVWWKEAPADRSHIQVSLDYQAGNWFLYSADWAPWAVGASVAGSTSYKNFDAAVSRYFTWGEVWQWDTRRITDSPTILARIRQHALHLDALREAWGSGLIVTSWYRDPATNAAVGGVANSQHLTGGAADLYPSNGQLKAFEDYCVAHWEYGGIGKGVSSGKGFVHLDDRGQRVIWLY